MKAVFKNPINQTILIFLGALFFYLLADIVAAVFLIFDPMLAHPLEQMLFLLLYALLVKKLLGKPFSLGFQKENLKQSLILASPVLIAFAVNLFEFCKAAFLYDLAIEPSAFGLTVLIAVLNGLRPGFVEEIIFRCLLMGSIMHFASGKTWRIPLAVFLPAFLFGLVHLINLLGSQALNETLFQVLYATAIGVLFGAAYARTHNLIGLILLHALVDFIPGLKAMLFHPPIAPVTTVDMILFVSVSIICLGFGLSCIRKSVWPQIEELWDKADSEQ